MLLVLAVLALTAIPASADAATFNVSVTPEAVTYPETKELTYRVEMRTIAAERITLTADGNGLVSPGGATLEGPGAISPIVGHSHGDIFPCGDTLGFRHFHHYLSASQTYTVDLPADSVSTFVLNAGVSPDAPRPGEEYRLTLGVPGGSIPIPAAGRKGVLIKIAMDPPNPSCGGENSGVPVTITGTTDPSLAGEELMLLMRHRASNAQLSPLTTHELARVRVADDGTFGLRDWRPQEVGSYAIQAQYKSNRPELADDRSEPLTFRLRIPVPLRPGPAVPPRQITTAPSLATVLPTASVRRGVARIRLRCSRSEACRGVVRLKVRAVFSQWRSFKVAAGKEKAVPIRLGASARRTLRTKTLNGVAQVRLNDVSSRTRVKLRAS